MTQIIDRYLKNLSSWALTTKILIIFHRCLQDQNLCTKMASELKTKEHLMHSFQKKSSDASYDQQMHQEVSVKYVSYLKFVYNFKLRSNLLNIKMTEVSQKIKQLPINDIFMNYENFDGLIS
jgi:hypothetical protein